MSTAASYLGESRGDSLSSPLEMNSSPKAEGKTERSKRHASIFLPLHWSMNTGQLHKDDTDSTVALACGSAQGRRKGGNCGFMRNNPSLSCRGAAWLCPMTVAKCHSLAKSI